MKAALYTRKSTDDSDKHEDNRSVARQIERARAFCAARDWTVAEDHIYADDGISGAEYQNRPGLLRLMAHLKEFDVVVMSEISRLGRDMVRNAVVIDELRGAGVQLWYYLTAEQEHADTPEQRIMVTLRSFAAEVERAKASQRTRDALERKALRGENAGGRVYGYHNVWIMDDGRRIIAPAGAKKPEAVIRTEYEIDAQEAEILRGVFRAYADGHGTRSIARALNGDPGCREIARRYFGAETPAPPWKGTQSWAPSSLREMLFRERYRGKIPYGEHRKTYRGGTKTRVRQAQYHRVDAPHLQIIDESLWNAVQARLRGARQAYVASIEGRPAVRPDTGRTSHYLISGLMRCGCCGGSMVGSRIAYGSGATRRREPAYLCSYRHNRGSTVCDNAHKALASEVDSRVIGAIEAQCLSRAAIDYVVDRVIEAVVDARRAAPDQLKQIEGELGRLNRELDRFMTLIAEGRAPERILAEISNREQRIRGLELERERLQAASPTAADIARIRELARKRIGQLRETLHGDIAGARIALRHLLEGPITFKPLDSDYRLEGKTRVGALLTPELEESTSLTPIRLASPRGFEPLLPP